MIIDLDISPVFCRDFLIEARDIFQDMSSIHILINDASEKEYADLALSELEETGGPITVEFLLKSDNEQRVKLVGTLLGDELMYCKASVLFYCLMYRANNDFLSGKLENTCYLLSHYKSADDYKRGDILRPEFPILVNISLDPESRELFSSVLRIFLTTEMFFRFVSFMQMEQIDLKSFRMRNYYFGGRDFCLTKIGGIETYYDYDKRVIEAMDEVVRHNG